MRDRQDETGRLHLQTRESALRFGVRVKPRSHKGRVGGVVQGLLEVAVRAPPTEGRANAELLTTLARYLNVPKSAVNIVSGGSARTKLVSVTGLSEAGLRAKLRE